MREVADVFFILFLLLVAMGIILTHLVTIEVGLVCLMASMTFDYLADWRQ